MFGIGGTELLIIAVIALLVFGPEQLPELARKLARIIGEVRRAGEEVRTHVDPDGELYRATRLPPIPSLPRYVEKELEEAMDGDGEEDISTEITDNEGEE